MFQSLTRLFRHVRRERKVGLGLLLAVVMASIVANAVSFFFFERSSDPAPTFFDSLWYSIVSITTIGYGDFSAVSLGARIATILFIIVAGLTAFSAAAAMIVDWILEIQYRERAGMVSVEAKSHLLIVNFPNEARVRQIVEEFVEDPQYGKEEIVIATDQVESLPFSIHNVSFVRGSPLEEETYRRANVARARQAIVLSTGYDDPNSDSVVASVVSVIEHLNPKVRTVAECLNERHAVLFAGAKNVSLVYTLHLASNLLVQETQDPGVNLLTQAITSNQIDGTMASAKVEGGLDSSPPYIDVARKLLDKDINLMGVIRQGAVHVSFAGLTLTEDDSLVYICSKRHSWETIRTLLD